MKCQYLTSACQPGVPNLIDFEIFIKDFHSRSRRIVQRVTSVRERGKSEPAQSRRIVQRVPSARERFKSEPVFRMSLPHSFVRHILTRIDNPKRQSKKTTIQNENPNRQTKEKSWIFPYGIKTRYQQESFLYLR